MTPLRQYRLGRTVATVTGLTALALSETAPDLGLLLTVPCALGLAAMARGLGRGA